MSAKRVAFLSNETTIIINVTSFPVFIYEIWLHTTQFLKFLMENGL